ncbi:MAG: ATP-grasp domain-containing protein [Treponema sp.]|nr:ATP-grasp domain-containing protein [Treponema sp.]
MTIVFYSTNSNLFDPSTYKLKLVPSNEEQFKLFQKSHPEHKFICVSQFPASFMPEESTLLLDKALDAQAFALEIEKLNPDLLLPMTFWVDPFDWLSVNDALVAQYLEKKGIKCLYHSLKTSLICFDKYKTQQKLLQNGFNVAKGIYVDHDLYFCAGSHKNVINNVYKASIRSQLEELKLPLIIKDTVGLSSYGMTVVHSYGEAIAYLNSKRNNSNRIIEEYLDGQQYGLEIYGLPGNYRVMPPFRFSLNQYGITSPKQSAKAGPEPLSKELESIMLRLAQCLQLKGLAQVDLIYKDSKWYIIEINPRLSGMTYLYAQSMGLSVFELIYKACIENSSLPALQNALSLKLPILNDEEMKSVLSIKGVQLLNQINDLAAKQEREKGFCECIIVSSSSQEIKAGLQELKKEFPDLATIQQSETILK